MEQMKFRFKIEYENILKVFYFPPFVVVLFKFQLFIIFEHPLYGIYWTPCEERKGKSYLDVNLDIC